MTICSTLINIERQHAVKDIIIRGGENIVSARTNAASTLSLHHLHQDSVSVENALYATEGVLEVAAIGVPHKRLGEVVAAVVSLKPGFRSRVTEASLIATASAR
jgi:acyl-CoA synthetase (AMP-forming)/AMP-acid ligase II